MRTCLKCTIFLNRRGFTSIQPIRSSNKISTPSSNAHSAEETISLIKEYNIKHTLSTDKWDLAFTNLLSNLNELNLPSLSTVLKECGIFIYRFKKNEKYDFIPNPEPRQRLFDALINSIIARISKNINGINDENAPHLLEILHFFSKNYYPSAYRVYETIDYNFKLDIKDIELRIKFIYTLTTFTRVYGMISPSCYHYDALKILTGHKKLSIQNSALLIDVLFPKCKVSKEHVDRILDVLLSLLNYTDFNMKYHMLKHRDLVLLVNNLVKLYKFYPSKKHFGLQKRLLTLHNFAHGQDNYLSMSPFNLIKITESLHKMLVIGILHDQDDITEECLSNLLKILNAMRTKMSSLPSPSLTRMLSILANVNYLAKTISPEFNEGFMDLLHTVDTQPDLHSLVVIINLLKKKTTLNIANKLLETLKKTNINKLSLKELNATLSCLLHVKDSGVLDPSDIIINMLSYCKHTDLEMDIAINLHSHNFITTDQLVELSKSSSNTLGSGQLYRLSRYLNNINIDMSIEPNDNEYGSKIQAVRSAKRLGLPIELDEETNC